MQSSLSSPPQNCAHALRLINFISSIFSIAEKTGQSNPFYSKIIHTVHGRATAFVTACPRDAYNMIEMLLWGSHPLSSALCNAQGKEVNAMFPFPAFILGSLFGFSSRNCCNRCHNRCCRRW